MAQSVSQSLGQYMRLEQKLTPQLIQSMNILQMHTTALENWVAEELEKNYALELAEAEHKTAEAPREERAGEGNGEVESFQRLERLAREYGNEDFFGTGYHGPRRAVVSGERDAKMDAMANAPTRPVSLAEHLMSQWAVVDLSDEVRRAGEIVIYSLEDDGYLKVPLAELAAKARPPVDLSVMEEGHRQVQRLDPVGVAARDVRECLLLQLDALPGDNRIEKELIRDHMESVVRRRYPTIAKATKYSVGEITEAVRAMQSTLYLHPGYLVVDRAAPRIAPDVIIDYADSGGGLEARLTRGSSPRLRISKSAMGMLKDKSNSKEIREFVREHVEAASTLMDAIKFRRERLIAVAEAIIEHQADFFEYGPEALKVLRMSDLAEELDCDPSTISRTVSGKYVQTPRGVFPMRYFFTGGTTTTDGENTSWDSVKAAVRKIVHEEDNRSPYNDDQIAAILSQRGVEISRRTVAKYRKQLDIPSARQRRHF